MAMCVLCHRSVHPGRLEMPRSALDNAFTRRRGPQQALVLKRCIQEKDHVLLKESCMQDRTGSMELGESRTRGSS